MFRNKYLISVLINKKEKFDLLNKSDGIYLISLLTGRVGLYKKFLVLNTDKLELYKLGGESHLIKLSQDIRKNEKTVYLNRLIYK